MKETNAAIPIPIGEIWSDVRDFGRKSLIRDNQEQFCHFGIGLCALLPNSNQILKGFANLKPQNKHHSHSPAAKVWKDDSSSLLTFKQIRGWSKQDGGEKKTFLQSGLILFSTGCDFSGVIKPQEFALLTWSMS